MRLGGLVMVLLLALSSYSCGRGIGATSPAKAAETKSAKASRENHRVDFETQIQPILKAKCQNCHFKGGTMYAKLPFDRPETIKHLGTKLFSRISEEDNRRLIREFLAQP